MGFILNSLKTLKNNHGMIRSRGGKYPKQFSLPPIKNKLSQAERLKIIEDRKREEKKKSIASYIALLILVATMVSFIFLCVKANRISTINKNLRIEKKNYDNSYSNNKRIADNKIAEAKVMSKGFYKLSTHQYEAALLHFESIVQVNKHSVYANLGLSYALVALCRRDNKHCNMKDSYINYLSGTDHYTATQLKYFNLFVDNKNVDRYLYSLVDIVLLDKTNI